MYPSQAYFVLYESLLLLLGILAILFNLVLLFCIWKATLKIYRSLAVFSICFSLLEIFSALFMLILQPRLLPTESIYFIILQGPIHLLNITYVDEENDIYYNYNNIVYNIYITLWYCRIVFFTIILIINTIISNQSLLTMTSSFMFSMALFLGAFVIFFIILSHCQMTINFVENKAQRLGIYISAKSVEYSVCWQGSTICVLPFILGCVIIAICVMWLPILLLMHFIKHKKTSKSKHLSETVKKRAKSNFILMLVWTLTHVFLMLPSLCVYVLYKNNTGHLLFHIDFIVYLFPLFADVTNPVIVIIGVKNYRDYVKKVIFKIPNKNLVMTIQYVASVNRIYVKN